MPHRFSLFVLPLLLFTSFHVSAQLMAKSSGKILYEKDVLEGAEQMEAYLPLLQGKRVAIVANHTALVNGVHLVDTLTSLGINIVRVFGPEHGFRGEASAGEKVASTTDEKTGIPLVSLYGKNLKPTKEQLSDVDIVVFDIQDVGARFYTYIGTMTYAMEACGESKKPFVVLDRPNPNGHYVDGPILESKYASFVGLHKVPVVHGMTVGEYACMVNGEKWASNGTTCDLIVIECKDWTHKDFYQLPVKPSPNLPNMASVYLYPTLCFFEGTAMSLGRGTDLPFQVVGHPDIAGTAFSFVPKSMPGAKNPKLEGKTCYGYNLSSFGNEYIRDYGKLYIFWIQDMYERFPDKPNFFTSYFNTLAGNSTFQEMIKAGKSEEEIRKTWESGLASFLEIRKKYLLYEDF